MSSATGEFGRRLRAARAYGRIDGSEVSQDDLAKALGQSREPIVAWESGKRVPNKGLRRGVIATIQELTGLPPEFFEVDFPELRRAMETYPDAIHPDPFSGPSADDVADRKLAALDEEVDRLEEPAPPSDRPAPRRSRAR